MFPSAQISFLGDSAGRQCVSFQSPTATFRTMIGGLCNLRMQMYSGQGTAGNTCRLTKMWKAECYIIITPCSHFQQETELASKLERLDCCQWHFNKNDDFCLSLKHSQGWRFVYFATCFIYLFFFLSFLHIFQIYYFRSFRGFQGFRVLRVFRFRYRISGFHVLRAPALGERYIPSENKM